MSGRHPASWVVGEMLVVETVARIRRAHFVQGKTIKGISREPGIARNTIRKVLRSGQTSFAYEREVQPRPKLGQWAAELERRLIANDRLSRRERLGLIRIFEDLRVAGYQGGYDAVRRFDPARRRKQGTGASDAFLCKLHRPRACASRARMMPGRDARAPARRDIGPSNGARPPPPRPGGGGRSPIPRRATRCCNLLPSAALAVK